jgi:hypothetical protein
MVQGKRSAAMFISAAAMVLIAGIGILCIPGTRKPYATPTRTCVPIIILLLEDDIEYIPEYLSDPLLQEQTPVSLQEAASVTADAILISREKLFMSSRDPNVKRFLRDIVESQKILLVYDASTLDVAQQLELGTPTMGTETTYHSVASVAMANHVIAAGGVLLSKGHSEEYLLQDIREYLVYFRSEIQRIQATASSSRDKLIVIPSPTP